MFKKTIFAIILFIGVFHAVWYAGSRIYQDRELPDASALSENQKRLFKVLDIDFNTKNFEKTSINSGKFSLHLTVFPAGKNKPAVVFVPGTAVYAMIYFEFMNKLYKQGFNVIGFDPRGHGMSSGHRGDYTINEIVDDTLAVVQYARKRFGGKVAVVGSSQGGLVAFYTAARDASIAAAVCHNLADLNGKDNLILSQFPMPRFMVPAMEILMGLYGSYSIPISLYLDLTKEKFKDGTDALGILRKDSLSVLWITVRAMRSLMHTELASPVEKITVPVMLIHTDMDSIFPQAYVEDIFKRLNCEKKYMLLKNREYLVMTNNVDEVMPVVSVWLKKVMR